MGWVGLWTVLTVCTAFLVRVFARQLLPTRGSLKRLWDPRERRWRVWMVIQFAAVLLAVVGTYKLFTGFQDKALMEPNSDCFATVDSAEPAANKNLCETAQKKPRRLLMLMLDSQATDVSDDLMALLADHAYWFRVFDDGPKTSNSVYTSFYTGKLNTNTDGAPIHADNMWWQMFRISNNQRTHYSGSGTATYIMPDTLGWMHNLDLYEDTVYMFSHMFAETTTQEQVDSKLDSATANAQENVYWQSNLLDSVNHEFGRHSHEAATIIATEVRHMALIKNWVDRHPEYLMVLCSDHGGRDVNQISLEMHGPTADGNEPFFLYYNADFHPSDEEKHHGAWIDVVDVAATTAQFMHGMSIPAESVGVAAPVSDDPVDRLRVYVQNAAQVSRLAKAMGIKREIATTKYQAMLDDGSASHEEVEAANAELKKRLQAMSDYFKSFRTVPHYHTILVVVGSVLTLLSMLNVDFPTLAALKQSLWVELLVLPPFIVFIVLEFPFFNAVICTHSMLCLTLLALAVSLLWQRDTALTYDPFTGDFEENRGHHGNANDGDDSTNSIHELTAQAKLVTMSLTDEPLKRGAMRSCLLRVCFALAMIASTEFLFVPATLFRFTFLSVMLRLHHIIFIAIALVDGYMHGLIDTAAHARKAVHTWVVVGLLCLVWFHDVVASPPLLSYFLMIAFILHLVVLLFLPAHHQRFIAYPLVLLEFFLIGYDCHGLYGPCPDSRRLFLLMRVLCMEAITQIAHIMPFRAMMLRNAAPDPPPFVRCRQILPMALILFGMWSFFVEHFGEGKFDVDCETRLPNLKLAGSTEILVGVFILYRKFAPMISIAGFMIRLATTPQPPNMQVLPQAQNEDDYDHDAVHKDASGTSLDVPHARSVFSTYVWHSVMAFTLGLMMVATVRHQIQRFATQYLLYAMVFGLIALIVGAAFVFEGCISSRLVG